MDDELARQLVDAAPAFVLVLDGEARVVRVNPLLEEFTGFAGSEVFGHDWITEFVPEHGRADARELFERTLRGDSVVRVIHPIVTRSGEERVVEWHGRALDVLKVPDGAVLALGFDVTERAAADAALRKSQEQLNEAQHLAKIGSWRLDLRDDTLSWSDEIYRIFEIDPMRFGASYEAFLEAIHPDDREAVNRAYTDSVESREPYDIVHRLHLPSGLTKWVHERCETRYDERGSPMYSTGTVQDITEQVLAQRTLGESQKAYRRLYEASRLKEGAVDATPNAIAFWSFDGTISYVNPAFVRMWGFAEPDEIIGRAVTELAPDPAEAEKIMHRALAGEPIPSELTARRKSGEEFTVLIASTMLRDEKGAPVQFMGAFVDVTQRRRAEDQVNRTRALLRSVVDSSPDWIFAKDFDHRFLLVNRAFAEAHRTTPEQIEGRLDTEVWSRGLLQQNPERDIERAHQEDRRALRGEIVHVPNDRLALPDGTTRVFHTSKVPLRDDTGAIRGVLCCCRDMSEQPGAPERDEAST